MRLLSFLFHFSVVIKFGSDTYLVYVLLFYLPFRRIFVHILSKSINLLSTRGGDVLIENEGLVNYRVSRVLYFKVQWTEL